MPDGMEQEVDDGIGIEVDGMKSAAFDGEGNGHLTATVGSLLIMLLLLLPETSFARCALDDDSNSTAVPLRS
jgi:hypothetical protein